jgi:hypothetical protein
LLCEEIGGIDLNSDVRTDAMSVLDDFLTNFFGDVELSWTGSPRSTLEFDRFKLCFGASTNDFDFVLQAAGWSAMEPIRLNSVIWASLNRERFPTGLAILRGEEAPTVF